MSQAYSRRRLSNFHVISSHSTHATTTANNVASSSSPSSSSVFTAVIDHSQASTSSPTSSAYSRNRRLSNFHHVTTPHHHHPKPSALEHTSTHAQEETSQHPLQQEQRRRGQSSKLKRHTSIFNSTSSNSITDSRSNSSSKQKQQLSKEEITQMYSSTIKLCQDNKINSKNTWNLNLIDYMPTLLKHKQQQQQQYEEEQQQRQQQQQQIGNAGTEDTDFQLAGVTLDAGVKIYCSRVDAVHTNAFKVLGGLSHQQQQQQKSILDDDDENYDDDDNGTNKSNSKKNRNTGRITLETNMKNITIQRLETDLTIDPLFQKMSAAFDEGGASGMLIHNLPISPYGNIVFDSSEPLSLLTSIHDLIDDSDDEHDNQYDCSSNLLPSLSNEHSLCEKFNKFYQHRMGNSNGEQDYDAYYDSQNHGDNSVNSTVTNSIDSSSVHIAHSQPSDFINFEYDDHDMQDDTDFGSFTNTMDSSSFMDQPKNGDSMMGSSTATDNFHGTDVALENEDDVNLFDPSTIITTTTSTVNNSNHSNIAIPNTKTQVDLVEAGLKLQSDDAYAFFSNNALSGWAGPQHWRFNRRQQDDGDMIVDGHNTNEKKKSSSKKKRGKKAMLLDFSIEAPPVDFEKEFRQAKSDRSISLVSATRHNKAAERNITLPTDLHLGVDWLTQLFLKSGVRVCDSTNHSTIQVTDRTLQQQQHDIGGDAKGDDDNDEGGGNEWHDFDNEHETAQEFGGDEWVNTADGGDDDVGDDDDDGLVEAPRKVEALDIGFARVAKKVDVRTLKSGLWSRLCSTSASEDSVAIKQEDSAVDEESVEKEERLQNVVKDMDQFIGVQSLADVTLPYVFICLLHLANEKGLEIESSGMDDAVIQLPRE